MELYKRDCGINMRLVPYGGGWTDVYLDIQGDSHYFIISNVMGDQFEDLLAILYCLYPGNAHESYQYVPNMDMKHALKKATKNGYVTVRIADDTHDWEGVCADIPWKARFAWYDEEAGCSWELEREPNEDLDFDLKIRMCTLPTRKSSSTPTPRRCCPSEESISAPLGSSATSSSMAFLPRSRTAFERSTR